MIKKGRGFYNTMCYFLALGDSQFEEGIREDPTGMKSLYYMAAKMSYENVFKMTYPIYDHFDIIT